ncbi:hypothetical protein HRbin09_01030 [bacterium HR09]|nr:hypothetical protein HRbin09_01030 [bacterium HR09]
MPARLTLYLPSHPALAYDLEEGRVYVIGRGEGCDIPCEDERVSRRHGELYFEGGSWFVRDLGSKNGTSVQGVAVQQAVLSSPAWLSFGGVLAHFEVVSAERRQKDAEERLRRWRSSAELSRQLTPADGVPVLLHKVLHGAMNLTGMERGFVMLREDGDLAVAATAGLEVANLARPEFSGSLGAVERAVATLKPVVATDVGTHPSLASRPSVVSTGIHAILCLPLVAAGELVGVLYLDSQKAIPPLHPLDVEILESYVAHAALAIALARLEAQAARFFRAFQAQAGENPLAALLDTLTPSLSQALARSPEEPQVGPTLAELLHGAAAEPGER